MHIYSSEYKNLMTHLFQTNNHIFRKSDIITDLIWIQNEYKFELEITWRVVNIDTRI
jgi:hypothetical protein